MIVTLIGALLILGGVGFMAYEAIWRGRLSGVSRWNSTVESTTLEPKGRSAAFDPRANRPDLALIVLGSILIYVGTAYL